MASARKDGFVETVASFGVKVVVSGQVLCWGTANGNRDARLFFIGDSGKEYSPDLNELKGSARLSLQLDRKSQVRQAQDKKSTKSSWSTDFIPS